MTWTKTYTGAEPVRVNKWLALEGVCSRREADTLIGAGLVTIDGQTITALGERIAPGQTLGLADRATNSLAGQVSVILNKPVGYVSGTPEPGETPAVRLIAGKTRFDRQTQMPDRELKLAPLGRLDKDSRGLLILSEDGVLAKALIGPESEIDKEYVVAVKGEISEEKLKLLRHGLELDGRKLRPALVDKIDDSTLRFVLREGRNRQIRRMCSLVHLWVTDLKRVRIGPIRLADLPEGRWRALTPGEREALLAVRSPQPRAARRVSGNPRVVGAKPSPGKPRAAPGSPPVAAPGRSPLKGDKFQRTKLKPRARTPIK